MRQNDSERIIRTQRETDKRKGNRGQEIQKQRTRGTDNQMI